MLDAASKRAGCTVELPFSVDNSDILYQVKVLVPEHSDPEWMMLSGSLGGMKVIWSLPSIDVQLIHSLIMSESMGKDSVDLITNTNSFQRSTTGNIALPSQIDEEAKEPAVQTEESRAARSSSQNLAQTISGKQETVQQASLEGDLEKLPLPAVLQSLSLGKKTGRVAVASQLGSAEVFMIDGAPVHAITGDFSGENALIEMLTWQSGKFKFFENERSGERTVNRRLDSLVMEGITLLDQMNYLKSNGLSLETYLHQAYPNLSETQFDQIANRGTGYNLQLQKDFYLEVDNQSNLYDLLRRLPLTKAEWVPVVFNLLQVGLVIPSDTALVQPVAKPEPEHELDQAQIQAALKPLMRPETEIFNYQLLQYFVTQEVGRFEADGKSFSLLIFDLMLESPGGLEVMPTAHAKAVLHRIKSVKREIDVLAHYETFDYALLLPQTSVKSANLVAQRIIERINASPLPGLESHKLNVCFGIAAVPQDCKSAGAIIMAAGEAKKHGRKNNIAIVEYKTMT